ncbi:MAG: hypothetical protein COX81_02370 [Candidatus Magasanikbacteria bacterium CG_4_10_14_0_2_um_filter_37_12]|uniref:SHS2 domain-containing protein n=1 Tax=Candidatus Magasanikbacteria bacterium CG_4_10_14_0_2_um_filter_37_12 TaxID=1974637 RepID=A0A2M7V7Y8_9BACT|nr:MAG: hypothetical protein COX81_02370 [Candidatus Magasanikbacteria bacterium CG_4_10_14_0_2_um_filter_37_12]
MLYYKKVCYNNLYIIYIQSMSLFHKNDSYLGIDIGAHGIKVVELRKFKGRPQLWTYGIADHEIDIHMSEMKDKTPEELVEEEKIVGKKVKKGDSSISGGTFGADDPRVDKYAELLKNVLEKAKTTTRRVTASLPVSHIFHAIVTLPLVNENEVDTIIQAELKKVLNRPVEEMQIVHQQIPDELAKQKKYMRVLVTAAPKVLVEFYSAIFARAGLELRELETEALAIERSLVGRDTSTMMVVDVGAERTNFFIIDQGLPMTHRSVQIGGDTINNILSGRLGVGGDIVEQVKTDTSRLDWTKINTSLFDSVTGPVVKEIEYSFDLFLSQLGNQNKRPEKIVLTGGSSFFPLLKQQIEKHFEMKVFVGDPWARVVYQQDLKVLLDSIGPRMAVSIGLALRNII